MSFTDFSSAYVKKNQYHFLPFLKLLEAFLSPIVETGSVFYLRSLKRIPKNVKLRKWDVYTSHSFQQHPKHVNLRKLDWLSHVGATEQIKGVKCSSSYSFMLFLKDSLWLWTLGAKHNESDKTVNSQPSTDICIESLPAKQNMLAWAAIFLRFLPTTVRIT